MTIDMSQFFQVFFGDASGEIGKNESEGDDFFRHSLMCARLLYRLLQ